MPAPTTSVRLDDEERAVIEQAAELDRAKNRHDWMRNTLVRAARRRVKRGAAVAEQGS